MDLIQKLYCQNHQNKQAKYLNLGLEFDHLLICSQCQIEADISPKHLVLLNHILDDTNKQKIISNFPPSLSQQMKESLKQLTNSQQRLQILEQLNAYFDTFQDQIIKLLSETKKKFILHIGQLEDQEEKIITKYREVSQLQQLISILNEEQSDKSQQLQKMKNLLVSLASSSQDIESNLQVEFLSYAEITKQINFDQLNGIKQMILSLLSKIGLQANEKPEDIQFKENNSSQSELQQLPLSKKQFEFEQMVSIPLKILDKQLKDVEEYKQNKNKVYKELLSVREQLQENLNYLKRQEEINQNDIFLKQFSSQFDQLSSSFKQRNLDEQVIYDTFNNCKLKLLQKLVDQLLLLDTKSLNNIQLLIDTILNKKDDSNFQYIINRIGPDQEFYKQNPTVKKLFEELPVFDIQSSKKFKPLKIKLLPYQNNNNNLPLKILDQLNGKIEKYQFTLTSSYQDFTVKSSLQFENQKKYIIRFKFNMPFNQMLNTSIGLIQYNEQTREENFSLFLANRNILAQTFQIKGSSLNLSFDQSEELYEIEMRVSLDENLLLFTDFPNYSNVNYINSQSNYKIDKTSKWSVGVSLSGNQQKIVTITEILEVDEFSTLY